MFDAQGRLLSFFDKKNQREVIESGHNGNLFRIYEDIPIFWDAWDVEVYHLEKGVEAKVGSAKIYETGPLMSSLIVEHPITATSSLKQVISLSCVSPRLDFDTTVKWDENRKFLV